MGTKYRHPLWVLSVLLLAGSLNPALATQKNLTVAAAEKAITLEPNPENGKKIYQVCSVCHTPEGWGTSNGYYPQIAGQLPSVIIKQLADIGSRNRDNPTMLPFSMPESIGGAQGMADVAAYISTLPMSPINGQGPGFDLDMGESLYAKECAECHGDRGQGDANDHIPLIQGQHFTYLMRQFNWIKIGKRRNADQKMVKQIQRFTGREISAMMDYVSRLEPDEGKVAEIGWRNPDFPSYSRHAMPADIRSDEQMAPPEPPKRPRTPFWSKGRPVAQD
jgi:cytochrome c553